MRKKKILLLKLTGITFHQFKNNFNISQKKLMMTQSPINS